MNVKASDQISLLDTQESIECNYALANDIVESGSLSVLHLNIRSLNKNFMMLKELLHDLRLQNVKVDAVLLCETWLNNYNDSLVNIDGFNLITKHRQSGKAGGLAIYISDRYTATEFTVKNQTVKVCL